jgi:hypothetical protein
MDVLRHTTFDGWERKSPPSNSRQAIGPSQLWLAGVTISPDVRDATAVTQGAQQPEQCAVVERLRPWPWRGQGHRAGARCGAAVCPWVRVSPGPPACRWLGSPRPGLLLGST